METIKLSQKINPAELEHQLLKFKYQTDASKSALLERFLDNVKNYSLSMPDHDAIDLKNIIAQTESRIRMISLD